MQISAKKVIDQQAMELQRQQRKADVARLYLSGLSQWQIAQELRVSTTTIAKDLESIRLQWLQSSLRDFDQRKAEELARLERVEAEAWSAWIRSKEPSEQHRTKISKQREEVRQHNQSKVKGLKGHDSPSQRARARMEVKAMEEELTSKGSSGDPRFLELVTKCIDMRLKVIGAYKTNPTTTNQLIIQWDELYQRSTEVNPIQRQLLELAGGDPGLIEGNSHGTSPTLKESSSHPGVSPIVIEAQSQPHIPSPSNTSSRGDSDPEPIDWEKAGKELMGLRGTPTEE